MGQKWKERRVIKKEKTFMLKLATVFSGIGAIEHALDRMHG